jgi:hypothetical protein
MLIRRRKLGEAHEARTATSASADTGNLRPLRQWRTAYKNLLSMYPSTLAGPPSGLKITAWQRTTYGNGNAAEHLGI